MCLPKNSVLCKKTQITVNNSNNHTQEYHNLRGSLNTKLRVFEFFFFFLGNCKSDGSSGELVSIFNHKIHVFISLSDELVLIFFFI